MSSNNNTAAQVSVESFVNELKNAKIEQGYDLTTGHKDDPHGEYRVYHTKMTVGGVALTCERQEGGLNDYPVIDGLEKLNVIDNDGDKLSVRELNGLIEEHTNTFLYPRDVEKNEDGVKRERVEEARARAQRAAAGATPVGTATATAATATPTTAPRQ